MHMSMFLLQFRKTDAGNSTYRGEHDGVSEHSDIVFSISIDKQVLSDNCEKS